MKITHLGHACLLVEAADRRLLIDPGSFSKGFEGLTDLDAIVITHQHADHLDPQRAPALIKANSAARVFADPQSAAKLADEGLSVTPLVAGDENVVGDLTLVPHGEKHAFNHQWMPTVDNVGVLVHASGEPTLYHPGDAYDAQPGPVDILAVPINAPWCAVRDTIDFVRRLAPRSFIPIHDALLSEQGRPMYITHTQNNGGDGLTLHDLAGRGSVQVSG